MARISSTSLSHTTASFTNLFKYRFPNGRRVLMKTGVSKRHFWSEPSNYKRKCGSTNEAWAPKRPGCAVRDLLFSCLLPNDDWGPVTLASFRSLIHTPSNWQAPTLGTSMALVTFFRQITWRCNFGWEPATVGFLCICPPWSCQFIPLKFQPQSAVHKLHSRAERCGGYRGLAGSFTCPRRKTSLAEKDGVRRCFPRTGRGERRLLVSALEDLRKPGLQHNCGSRLRKPDNSFCALWAWKQFHWLKSYNFS